MKKHLKLHSVVNILAHTLLITLAVLALAAFSHFILQTPMGGLKGLFFILGIGMLIVAGLSIGGERQNFGIQPLFLPLQKILNQSAPDGLDGAAGFLSAYAFSLYVGLAGLITVLIGIWINSTFSQ